MNISVMLRSHAKGATLFALLCFGVCTCLHGQTAGKGQLRYAIYPETAIIKLDGVKLDTNLGTLELDTGNHVFQFWAPRRSLIVDTVFVKPGRNNYVRVATFSEEFLAYRSKAIKQKALKIGINSVVPGISSYYFLTAVARRVRAYDNSLAQYQDEANNAQRVYQRAFIINDINESKSDFDEAKEAYENELTERNRYVTKMYVLGGASIIASVGIWVWTRKWSKPVYTESPLLTRIKPTSSFQFNTHTFGITISI